jgi:hypothetical protein
VRMQVEYRAEWTEPKWDAAFQPYGYLLFK